MLVRPYGRSMLLRLTQSSNAMSPIDSSLEEYEMLTRLEQPVKEPMGMEVTSSGRAMLVKLAH